MYYNSVKQRWGVDFLHMKREAVSISPSNIQFLSKKIEHIIHPDDVSKFNCTFNQEMDIDIPTTIKINASGII